MAGCGDSLVNESRRRELPIWQRLRRDKSALTKSGEGEEGICRILCISAFQERSVTRSHCHGAARGRGKKNVNLFQRFAG